MMCFYNDDYDWIAEVCTSADEPSGKECHCNECGGVIAADEPRHTIYQQEHEACQVCVDEFSDDYIDRAEMVELSEADDADAEDIAYARDHLKTLDEHEHVYGETFSYARCLACDKLIRAVEDREKAEGCPAYAQRPALLDLCESLWEHDDGAEYARHAVKLFPELATHPIVVHLLEKETSDAT